MASYICDNPDCFQHVRIDGRLWCSTHGYDVAICVLCDRPASVRKGEYLCDQHAAECGDDDGLTTTQPLPKMTMADLVEGKPCPPRRVQEHKCGWHRVFDAVCPLCCGERQAVA